MLILTHLTCFIFKVYDSAKSDGHIELSILESGHFLLSLAEELLVSVITIGRFSESTEQLGKLSGYIIGTVQ